MRLSITEMMMPALKMESKKTVMKKTVMIKDKCTKVEPMVAKEEPTMVRDTKELKRVKEVMVGITIIRAKRHSGSMC